MSTSIKRVTRNVQPTRRGTAVTTVVTESRGRRRNRRGGSSSGAPRTVAAPVAIASTVQSRSSRSVSVSGTDRLLYVPNVAAFQHGGRVVDQPITPSLFSRLSKQAETFQKIKWRRLVFHIRPAVPTSSSGSYVTSFVADPSDEIGEGEEALDRLTGQAASKSASWWQPTDLSFTPPNRTLFTSPNSEDRMYSPGRFVLFADGPASQEGSLTITCDWSVTLSVPSNEGVGVSVVGLRFTASAGIKGSETNFHKDANGSGDASTFCNVEEIVGDSSGPYYFKPAFPFRLETGAGDSTSILFRYLKLEYENTSSPHWQLYPCRSVGGPTNNTKATVEEVFYVAGDEAIPVFQDEASVTHLKVLSRNSPRGAKLFLVQPSIGSSLLSKIALMKLPTASTISSTYSAKNSSKKDSYPSKELDKLMASLQKLLLQESSNKKQVTEALSTLRLEVARVAEDAHTARSNTDNLARSYDSLVRSVTPDRNTPVQNMKIPTYRGAQAPTP